MPAASDEQELVTTVVRFVESGAYPDNDGVASTEVTAAHLPAIARGLQTAQEAARAEIKRISQGVAPDVDDWIKQAAQLQADIKESQSTAQQIVKEAREAQRLREDHADVSQKAKFLRAEVDFHSKLQSILEDVRDVANALNAAHDAAKEGRIKTSLKQLQHVQSVLQTFEPLKATAPIDILQQRTSRLRETIVEQVQEQWAVMVTFDKKRNSLQAQDRNNSDSELSLDQLVDLLDTLGLKNQTIAAFCRDFDETIVTPLLDPTKPLRIAVQQRSMTVRHSGSARTINDTLQDLENIAKTLHAWIPFMAGPVNEHLASTLTTKLLSKWLGPAVPVELEDVPRYQDLLSRVSQFQSEIGSSGWTKTDELTEWRSTAPKVWLAKRREDSLSRIRSLLTKGLYERKTVERVETQIVTQEDMISPVAGGDDWNEDWGNEEDDDDETGEQHGDRAPAQSEDTEADASAWGWEEDGESSPVAAKKEANGGDDAGEDEAAAWGWDGDEAEQAESKPASPVKLKKQKSRQEASGKQEPQQREVTLRESYTTTAVPDELLKMITDIVKTAEALREPAHAELPVAPAAVGLFSIPTLALAGFRALAPNFYQNVVGGNMFLYNDSVRLAEELRKFAQEQARRDEESGQARSAWPSSRMKLDVEIDALEAFSRRAYGREMDSQRTILRDLLDGAQGFANCAEQPFSSECANAVAATADRIRDVSKEWTAILSKSALLQSLGSLLSTVIHKMIVEIEDLSDIGEEESKQLRKLCTEMAKVSDLFEQDEQQADVVAIYTPNWIKFQILAELLESSLADIKHLWHDLDLKLEFTAHEVVDLIEALFAESDLRRRAIAEIRRG